MNPKDLLRHRPARVPKEAAELLSGWGRLWQVPDLKKTLRVEFSNRLKSSLGRCLPKRHLIRLNPILLQSQLSDLFGEVLCHEAAHYVVFRKFGPDCRPHGLEWRQLVEAAGFEPRPTIKTRQLGSTLSFPRKRSAVIYEHRCPVCQSFWVAQRPMRQWRCSNCMETDTRGKLEITSRRAWIMHEPQHE